MSIWEYVQAIVLSGVGGVIGASIVFLLARERPEGEK